MSSLPLTFEDWIGGAIAALLVLAIAFVVARCRLAVPRATLVLAAAGIILLALAAGGLTWMKPMARPVAVLVDLSPSTRGASYRDPKVLRQRIRELVGDIPYE